MDKVGYPEPPEVRFDKSNSANWLIRTSSRSFQQYVPRCQSEAFNISLGKVPNRHIGEVKVAGISEVG